MPDLLIRDAHDSDRAVIQDVTLSAYQEYAALMVAHWDDYRQSILATLADVKPAEQVVAEQDGTVMGTVLLYPAGTAFTNPAGASAALKWPEVRLLAVAPVARGQGIGAALIRECIQRARQSGSEARKFHLITTPQAKWLLNFPSS